MSYAAFKSWGSQPSRIFGEAAPTAQDTSEGAATTEGEAYTGSTPTATTTTTA